MASSEQPKQGDKPMDELALVAAIDDADNRSYGSNLSNLTAQLSAERALNIDLYLGKNVDPAPDGESNVVDRTVFETVQWILPSLCNIFANGDDVVTVVPIGPDDVQQAQQETAYMNWLVTTKHSWFDLFTEFATDALLTKNAYMLVYVDRKQTVNIEKYENQTRIGVAYLTQDKDVQVVDLKEFPATDLPPEMIMGPYGQPVMNSMGQPMTQPAKLYNVTIRRRQTDKDICIRTLPPERVKIDQRAYNWRIDDRTNYFEYWEETTLSELREQGFDIPDDTADDPEIQTQEDYARDQYGERRLERYKPTDPSMRRVKARMIWIRCDYDGDGVSELLQILRVGRKLLYVEEVSRIPVASGVACPLPHRHIGISMADMTADIQRIKTTVLRQGLNNLYLANNPQKVLNEQFVNLDDALISRAGGVIRASDINQLRYEQAPFVFPQVVEGLQYLDEIRQNRTGVNNNFAGIDSKSISNVQPGTVSQLSGMAASRVEQIARVLAVALEDLFSIGHEQVLKNGHKRQVVKLLGNWAEVDPGSWKKRTDFKACVAFSAGNKDSQMMRLMAIAQAQKEALELGIPVCTPQNYYETLIEMTKSSSLSAPERFWTDPQKIPRPPPPPPEGIVQAQIKADSDKQIKAADIMQREVESQRKAAIDKYAIDANTGLHLIDTQTSHENNVVLETLKSSHKAALDSLGSHMKDATNGVKSGHAAMGKTHDAIISHTQHIVDLSKDLGHIAPGLNKAVAIATGKKVIRKHPKTGATEGIDVLDSEGKVIHSTHATKDAQGRITGME